MRGDHSWRSYGGDDVACSLCGAEPWHRDAAEACPASSLSQQSNLTHQPKETQQ